ncbi:hypothetical protein MMC10_010977 [Thelotrema lepadinum]|nr:hypothetical protein [Thelotrema lepadinum]
MPHPGLPLTPASSTDLLAKERHDHYPTEKAFNLPPPAIHSTESSASSNASVKSDSSYKPISPSSSRKRLRNADSPKEVVNTQPSQTADISLPPPPTRSRRIIQMKPSTDRKSVPTTEKAEKKKPAAGRSRANSTTTAVGKKTARKTAHSIIERRRRSKMNEEFETLKGMIPACTGQSMHKLAILQAGIDYMRYLEQCVTDLKGSHRAAPPLPLTSQSQAPTPRAQSAIASEASSESEDEDEDEEDGDEMQGIDKPAQEDSPAVDNVPSRGPSRGYTSSLTSPNVLPQPQEPAIWSTHTSALPSPAFGPRNDSWSSLDRPRLHYAHSADTSPAILADPMHDAAHEATAALLMLNHDRRHSRGEKSRVGGGLSVRDLLSS